MPEEKKPSKVPQYIRDIPAPPPPTTTMVGSALQVLLETWVPPESVPDPDSSTQH
ncbi:MAG: hypothetical protein QM601_06275 [Pseudoxanthomonas sp.]